MKKIATVLCLISVFLVSGCIIGGHGHPDRHHGDNRGNPPHSDDRRHW